MENPPTPILQTKPEKTVGELVQVPFWPVTVLRPLGPYGHMLDLEPGVPTSPDPEFLVRLVTGHQSHQAQLRHEAGAQFKNLENLVRGKHKSSPTTKAMLASKLGVPIDFIDKIDGCAPEGPLLPDLMTLFRMMEVIPTFVASAIFGIHVPCECCGANLIEDKDHWWSKAAPGIGVAELRFAERLLSAILGASLIESFLGQTQTPAENHLKYLANLSIPSKHPIGHWLTEAQTALGRDSLADLTTELQLRKETAPHFSYARMKKWSAGQDVMPVAAGEMIADACGKEHAKTLKLRLTAARAIAMVIDFVAATLPSDAGQRAARAIVAQRFDELGRNLWVVVASRPKS